MNMAKSAAKKLMENISSDLNIKEAIISATDSITVIMAVTFHVKIKDGMKPIIIGAKYIAL